MRLTKSLILLFLPLTVAASKGLPRFVDYPVAKIVAARSPLRLSHDDQDYKTRLRELYRSPPNFAGHYVVGEVGCGTFCSFLLAVDLKTGRPIGFNVPSGEDLYVCDDSFANPDGDVPGGIGSKFYFKPDSRLFVVTGKMPGNDCGARYFVETNGKMVQVAEVHLKARQ